MGRDLLPEEAILISNASPPPMAKDSTASYATRNLKDDVSRRRLLAIELALRVLGALHYCTPQLILDSEAQ